MLVLVILSFVILVGFLSYNVYKFRLQSCISAYSDEWVNKPVNLWSVAIMASALLLMPVLLELTANRTLQFVGFLAPISMLLVGLTPKWFCNTTQYWFHNIGVVLAVIFITVFSFILKLWWVIPIYLAAAGIATYFNKRCVTMWFELAAYLSIYTILIIVLC